MKTKEDFHKLIDEIEDEGILKGYYELIRKLEQHQTGELWDSLSTKEKQELLLSYEESFSPQQRIDHEQVKKQHGKWLKK